MYPHLLTETMRTGLKIKTKNMSPKLMPFKLESFNYFSVNRLSDTTENKLL